jgi:hypothetical protein
MSRLLGKYIGELVLGGFNHDRNWRVKNEFGFTEFDFIDPLVPDAKKTDKDWPVPVDTTTDGASIPRILWTIIGSPFTGKYVEAAVIHDYYCSKRTEHWRAVHRVFYKAMCVSGVALGEARLLYAGVRFGGRRWSEMDVHNARLPIPIRRPLDAEQKKFLDEDPLAIDLKHCFSTANVVPLDEADAPRFDPDTEAYVLDLDEEKSTVFAVYFDVERAYESIKKDMSREETVGDAQKLEIDAHKLEIIDLSLDRALQEREGRFNLRRRLTLRPARTPA